MRIIDLGREGIAQIDCYGKRTDDPNRRDMSLEKEGETWVILGDEDKLLIAAALELASAYRYAQLKEQRETDPNFSGSPLDVANNELAQRFAQLGGRFEATVTPQVNHTLAEQAVSQYLLTPTAPAPSV